MQAILSAAIFVAVLTHGFAAEIMRRDRMEASSTAFVEVSAKAVASNLEDTDVDGSADDEEIPKELLAKAYDINSGTIDGLACPNDGTPLSYEDSCKFLRDFAPYGFPMSFADIKYHASKAYTMRVQTSIGSLPPDDIYNSWVVPYRLVAENAEQWRFPFQKALYNTVLSIADIPTVVEQVIPRIWSLRTNVDFVRAALGANATPFNSSLQFLAGSANMQVLSETLVQGKADSLGLSIYAAAALRSVGIPARVVGVNQWGTRAGGAYHWVEFWTCRNPDTMEDVWSFFDADPTAANVSINSAWFVPSFTRYAQQGTATGIYAGTFNRELPDGTWNVSLPSSDSGPLLLPAVEVTDFYHLFNQDTTTTTLSTIVDLVQFAKDAGIEITTTQAAIASIYACPKMSAGEIR